MSVEFIDNSKEVLREVNGNFNYIFFTRAGYGAYQELGTSNIPARHMLQKGIHAAVLEINRKKQIVRTDFIEFLETAREIAKEECPVDKGILVNSIDFEETNVGRRATAI
jgi:hypothetical protein